MFLESVLVPMALLVYGQLDTVMIVHKANTCIAIFQH